MPKIYLVLAFVTAAIMAAGQLLFKSGANQLEYSNLPEFLMGVMSSAKIICAITLYAVTVLLWIHVLKHLPLAVAYPINGSAYILVPLLGYFFFNEKGNLYTVVGCLLIFGGICLTSLQSQ